MRGVVLAVAAPQPRPVAAADTLGRWIARFAFIGCGVLSGKFKKNTLSQLPVLTKIFLIVLPIF